MEWSLTTLPWLPSLRNICINKSNLFIIYTTATYTGINELLFLLPSSTKTMAVLYQSTPDWREQISAAGNSWTGAVAQELLGIYWASCVTWTCCYFRWIRGNFNLSSDTYGEVPLGNHLTLSQVAWDIVPVSVSTPLWMTKLLGGGLWPWNLLTSSIYSV